MADDRSEVGINMTTGAMCPECLEPLGSSLTSCHCGWLKFRYVPIDPIARVIRNYYFEPCKVSGAGPPWEDTQ